MKLRLIALSFVLVALVGCGGGGPSPQDIQQSIEKQGRAQLRQAEQMAVSMGGDRNLMRSMGQPAPEDLSVDSVEILESTALENGDYRVNFTADLTVGAQSGTRELETVVKNTDDGWHVVIPGGF